MVIRFLVPTLTARRSAMYSGTPSPRNSAEFRLAGLLDGGSRAQGPAHLNQVLHFNASVLEDPVVHGHRLPLLFPGGAQKFERAVGVALLHPRVEAVGGERDHLTIVEF